MCFNKTILQRNIVQILCCVSKLFIPNVIVRGNTVVSFFSPDSKGEIRFPEYLLSAMCFTYIVLFSPAKLHCFTDQETDRELKPFLSL